MGWLNDVNLAESIKSEYLGFLKKKGYMFKEDMRVDAGDVSSLVFDHSTNAYRITITGPDSLPHEMTHIVLQKDGISSIYNSAGGLSKPVHKPYARTYLETLVNAVPDYYINCLLLEFFNELPELGLKEAIRHSFREISGLLRANFLERVPAIAREHRSNPAFFKCVQTSEVLFYWYAHYSLYSRHKHSFLKVNYDFDKLVSYLDANFAPPYPGFFGDRFRLIKGFVDSMPHYAKLRDDCRKASCPLPTAKLSVRLFNIIFHGVDMERVAKGFGTKELLEFSSYFRGLIRENKVGAVAEILQQHGIKFNGDEDTDPIRLRAKEKELMSKRIGLVDGLVTKSYSKFIKECTNENTVFSVVLF